MLAYSDDDNRDFVRIETDHHLRQLVCSLKQFGTDDVDTLSLEIVAAFVPGFHRLVPKLC